jgi:hypothetical protein
MAIGAELKQVKGEEKVKAYGTYGFTKRQKN